MRETSLHKRWKRLRQKHRTAPAENAVQRDAGASNEALPTDALAQAIVESQTQQNAAPSLGTAIQEYQRKEAHGETLKLLPPVLASQGYRELFQSP